MTAPHLADLANVDSYEALLSREDYEAFQADMRELEEGGYYDFRNFPTPEDMRDSAAMHRYPDQDPDDEIPM
jgi:hypothetical protein